MAYYASNKIVVFPSSSATDSGKRLTEENVKEIVTRITERNYKIDSSSFVISIRTGSILVSSGSANIQGYNVVTTSNISVSNPEDNGTYIVGIRLRFDAGTGNILGDVGGNNVGVEVGFYPIADYEDDKNILKLARAVKNGSSLVIDEEEDILYRIDSALYAKEAGGVVYNGNTYVINQNLRTTDDVVFKSVQTDTLTFKDGDTYPDLKTVLDSIKGIIKGLKGTTNWDDTPSSTIKGLHNDKLDKSDVVDSATPNKVLRMNSSGELPVNITGNAASANSAGQSTYALAIGNQQTNYSLNQDLYTSSIVQFKGIKLNQSGFPNITFDDNRLSFFTGVNGFSYIYNSASVLTVSKEGNIDASGTIRGTRIYNAVYNDYAEWYEKDNPDEEINPGDIIEINPDTGKYRLCTSIASNLVTGVCSDSYGHILGGENLENMEDNNKKYVPIGLSGRVYVNVEDGVNIMPGQLIVSSHNGKAMTKVKTQEGTVIGKALGYVQKIDGVRKVLMQIMLR